MTVTRDGQSASIRGKGRHDPCVLPRAVPIVEAMVACVLVDAIMQQKAQCELFDKNKPFDTNIKFPKINPLGKKLFGFGID